MRRGRISTRVPCRRPDAGSDVKILLTGASSFTGFWFARTLAAAGHELVAPLRGNLDSLPRRGAVGGCAGCTASSSSFPHAGFLGSAKFLGLADSHDFDVLCHHGAEVGDYRNPEFDIARAAASNTLNLRSVLLAMSERGLKGVALIGQHFSNRMRARALSRSWRFRRTAYREAVTARSCADRCHEIGVPFGNSSSPTRSARWSSRGSAPSGAHLGGGRRGRDQDPDYIRDNIHVGLLAACYRRFVEETDTAPAFRKLNPSGYVESQGTFVDVVAREIGRRTGQRCAVTLLPYNRFPER